MGDLDPPELFPRSGGHPPAPFPNGTHRVLSDDRVKFLSWDPVKSEQLQKDRGISFEEIVYHLGRGDVLDILEHPNPKRYPGQRVFVVRVDEYVYLVPFVEQEREVFLKTIIPSRKATRRYLKPEEPTNG